MTKKADEIKKDSETTPETSDAPETPKADGADLGDLNTESENKPADLGDLNTKPTKTVDLGRLNLPKFKKFNKITK